MKTPEEFAADNAITIAKWSSELGITYYKARKLLVEEFGEKRTKEILRHRMGIRRKFSDELIASCVKEITTPGGLSVTRLARKHNVVVLTMRGWIAKALGEKRTKKEIRARRFESIKNNQNRNFPKHIVKKWRQEHQRENNPNRKGEPEALGEHPKRKTQPRFDPQAPNISFERLIKRIRSARSPILRR